MTTMRHKASELGHERESMNLFSRAAALAGQWHRVAPKKRDELRRLIQLHNAECEMACQYSAKVDVGELHRW